MMSFPATSDETSNRVCVQHTYNDHWRDPVYDGNACLSAITRYSDNRNMETATGSEPQNVKTVVKPRRGPRGGVLVPFPVKLHEMLSQAENYSEINEVVAWQPHGRCFVIHQPKRFVEEVMPK